VEVIAGGSRSYVRSSTDENTDPRPTLRKTIALPRKPLQTPHQQLRRPTLFFDTQAPLYALNDAAAYRIEAVTQVLENLSMRGSIECQSFILSDFALLCAIPLRDGCDLLEMVRQRLQPRPVAE